MGEKLLEAHISTLLEGLGSVVQLVRTLHSHCKGQRFESSRVHIRIGIFQLVYPNEFPQLKKFARVKNVAFTLQRSEVRLLSSPLVYRVFYIASIIQIFNIVKYRPQTHEPDSYRIGSV